MGYLATGGLSAEQEAALLDVAPGELRKLETAERIRLGLAHKEFETRKREAFWTAVAAAIPLATILGVSQWFGGGRRR